MENPTGLSAKEYARIQAIMAQHADTLNRARQILVSNMDIPAQRTINAACHQMGIKRIDWEKIDAVRNGWEFRPPPAHILRRWESY